MNNYSILYRTYEQFYLASKNNPTVLFDVGYGNICFDDLCHEIDFKFAVTNNFWDWHQTVADSIEVFSPCVLSGNEVILISNSRYAFEVCRQCREYGISEEKIFCYMFFDENFDSFLRIEYDKKGR